MLWPWDPGLSRDSDARAATQAPRAATQDEGPPTGAKRCELYVDDLAVMNVRVRRHLYTSISLWPKFEA